jgi:hypothetical protein
MQIRKGTLRWMGRVIGRTSAIAGLLIVSLLVSGCGLFTATREVAPPPTQHAATPVEAAGAQRTPTPVPPTPTPVPPPRATPIPAPTPVPVTQGEAQAVVRAWFGALAAQDYAAMEELTAEDATLHTRGLAEAIQLEAGRERVNIGIVTRRLELQPGLRLERGEAVDTDFHMDVNALVGPFSFTARQMPGSATFIVDRVDGDAKIVDIQDVTGLPEP